MVADSIVNAVVVINVFILAILLIYARDIIEMIQEWRKNRKKENK